MKKSKIMLSTLAAAVFATSAGALVACGEDVKLPDGLANKGVLEITLNANGGLFSDKTATKTVKTDINGLITSFSSLPDDLKPTRSNWVFTGYYVEKTGADASSTEIKYGTGGYKFETAITVYAHWKKEEEQGQPEQTTEFKITFDVGDYGTCATTELTTVNGKITLPDVTVKNPATHKFLGWYTAKTGGDKVENDKDYTAATPLYAQYESIPQGDEGEEYTVTLDAGVNGSYGASTLTTVGGKLTGLTDAVANSGWKFEGWYTQPNGGGSLVTTNTPFNANGTTIYAHYTETSENPTTDPDAPAAQYTAVTINGEDMDNNTSWINREWVEYPDYTGWNNHTQTDEFIGYLTVEQETTYTLEADGTPITTLWVSVAKTSNAEVKIGDVLVTKDSSGSTQATSFSLVEGNYSVYLKVYTDGGHTLEIQGTQEGVWENVNVRPSTDPNPAARVYTSAKWNGNAMTDATDEVGRAWVADDTKPEGGYYTNHNLADEFKATISLEEQTTVTFTIGDNDKAISMWVKHAQAVQVKVGDTLVPYDGQTGTNGGATSSNGSIVLAAGDYTVYLTNYGTEGDDDLVLWVQGTQTGEFGGGGGGGEETELPTVSVKNGSVEIELVHNPENTTATYEFMLATGGKISLNKNDVLTVLINGESPAPNFNLVDSHGVTYSGNTITVTAPGEFTFYLRYYENGDWWNVEMNDGETDEIHEGHYYLVGAGQDFNVCYEDRYVGETSGEIEVTVGNNPVSFKLAKSTATGATDWTSNTHLGSNDVTVGRGYITSDSDGNIVLTTPGTYTVKLVDGHIEITSDDVEENTNTPYTANVTLANGKKVKITFAMPTNWGLSAAELNSCVITINGTKSVNIKSDSSVDLDASDIALGKVTVKVSFRQNGGNKITSGEITLEDGASYMISFGSWIEDVPGGATFQFNVSKS